MVVLRLASGNDIVVKLSAREVLEALSRDDDAFVELPGEEVPVFVRRSGVVAIVEDKSRGTTGFRLATAEGGGS